MRAFAGQLGVMIAVIHAEPAIAFPDGAPWGAADPGAEQHCAACHFDFDPKLESSSLSIRGLPKKLEPNTTYDLEIVFEDTADVVAGFQLLAQTANGRAGTFNTDVANVEFVGASVRSTAPQKAYGRVAWKMRWRTPVNFVSPITFYLAVSAVNDDGSPFGDTIHFKTYELSVD